MLAALPEHPSNVARESIPLDARNEEMAEQGNVGDNSNEIVAHVGEY